MNFNLSKSVKMDRNRIFTLNFNALDKSWLSALN